jgi:anhydro-N-acetylmuramic acid kinase
MVAQSVMMKAIGLMSGTSMDGVDIALIETDGKRIGAFGATGARPYTAEERALLRAAVDAATILTHREDRTGILGAAEDMVTAAHAEAVEDFLAEHSLRQDDIAVVGFHGQTVLHRPEAALTVQLGNGQVLADRLGIDVVYDFRAADVAAGGQGAPFVPVYHRALAQMSAFDLALPTTIINVGGVANVTWIGEDGDILAFDTGPGNALIDDWVRVRTGAPFDENGRLAACGMVDPARLERLLSHLFFTQKPPKSLDRNDFSLMPLEGLSLEDGAATLTAFTAATLGLAAQHFPKPARLYVLAGGGARNGTLIRMLRERVPGKLVLANDLGWSGDALEAQAFGYLAARSLKGLPITYPTTTGVSKPMTGGKLARFTYCWTSR